MPGILSLALSHTGLPIGINDAGRSEARSNFEPALRMCWNHGIGQSDFLRRD